MSSNVFTSETRGAILTISGVLLLNFAVVVLSGCGSGSRSKGDNVEKLSVSQQLEDLETFRRVVTAAHPHMTSPDTQVTFAKAYANCRRRLKKKLSLGQFHDIISPVADALKDDHTMVYSPQGRSISEQCNFAEQIYSEFKNKETVESNSYKIMKEQDICILKFNTCGMLSENSLYIEFFERLFMDINEQGLDTLVIDIRRNQGGYSGNASELLRYIANVPFRQYVRAEQRISQESLAFFDKCEINLTEYLEKDYDITGLKDGTLLPGTYVMQARYVNPVDEAHRFKGKTYVLIGPDVFSSGMLFANTVQHYKMAPLVGRKIRWKFGTQHVGEVLFGDLPNSHLVYMVSTTTFTVPRSSEIRAAYIIPDHKVPTWKLWTSGRADATLDYAIKLARN